MAAKIRLVMVAGHRMLHAMKTALTILSGFFFVIQCNADDVIAVSEHGAKGDAIKILASTQSGSPLITLSGTRVSASDKGKVVMLYGAGPNTTVTNNQDLLARVVDVPDENHLRLSLPSGITATNLHGILGTDNAHAFQLSVDRAFGSNTVISVPPGNYLMIPPGFMDRRNMMAGGPKGNAAVVITKGGVTFKGVDPKTTILTACGAWQLKGKVVSRGQLFQCLGPVSHPEFPLAFENLTMDGGVEKGRLDYRGFPARNNDGLGWDITHGAVLDSGQQPLHAMKIFRNCIFERWRGEILKGVSGAMTGFIEVTGCNFYDGNASAFNFDVAHHIDHCTFDHLDMAMEFYEGRMDRPSIFENSSVSDVRADLVIVGALTNHPAPLYTIRNNYLQASNGFGVFLNPAKNVLIESNRFEGQGFCIGNGAGAQGTDYSHDIVIRGNSATNGGDLFLVQCGYSQRFENVLITGNSISGRGHLGCGWGYSTNVTFSNNIATNGAGGIDGTRLTGQWFLDDLSNHYHPHQVYNYSGMTNLITYANGARQEVLPVKTNSLCIIDDSHPEKIPTGAMMTITNQGNHPIPLYLSTLRTNQPPAVSLNPGSVVTCAWTNGGWRMATSVEGRETSADEKLK